MSPENAEVPAVVLLQNLLAAPLGGLSDGTVRLMEALLQIAAAQLPPLDDPAVWAGRGPRDAAFLRAHCL
jgi:hypothetical protein